MDFILSMKNIEASYLLFNSDFPDLDSVSAALDSVEKNKIDQINWADFIYKPEAAFSIGYTEREIMLKYFVTEDCFKAEQTESNQNIWEDSCVEFFVSPADDSLYYNFEFNGIGTCLLGAGASRDDRNRADPRIIAGIRRKSSAGTLPVAEIIGKFTWTLTIAIPFYIFFHHKIEVLKGKSIKANFYKCGDKLSKPHYVTWSPVRTPRPDFHRPEFFGIIKIN
jgi:hypothetical protein